MKLIIKKMKNLRAFTLIEVMICIILTCIVVFFIYTMMLSSHKTYSKLFTISRQRNDLRYFETLLKNSIMNAENYSFTTKKMTFGYYDRSGIYASVLGTEGDYRVDEYEFDNNNVLENNENKSENLNGLSLPSFSGTQSNMTLTIYKGQLNSSKQIFPTSTKLRDTEVVLENVNKLFWCYHDYNENPPAFNHQSYLNLALIFNKELAGTKAALKEINYESQLYRFSMKNIRFKNN
jgi:prepilin-type N-terminal cleavage/methylation domain-containing protein